MGDKPKQPTPAEAPFDDRATAIFPVSPSAGSSPGPDAFIPELGHAAEPSYAPSLQHSPVVSLGPTDFGTMPAIESSFPEVPPNLSVGEPPSLTLPAAGDQQAPDGSSPAAASPRSGTGVVVAVARTQESIDEVLNHSSEQAVRLSHLEELLGGFSSNLNDLAEMVQAGLAEIRSVVSQQGGPQQRETNEQEALRIRTISERLDQLEALATQSARAQAMKTSLLLVLAVIIAAGIASVAFGVLPARHDDEFSDTLTSVPDSTGLKPLDLAAPALKDVTAITPSSAPAAPSKNAKAAKRKAHR